jgi:hypothetical protein
LVAVVAVAVLAAACGSDAGDEQEAAATEEATEEVETPTDDDATPETQTPEAEPAATEEPEATPTDAPEPENFASHEGVTADAIKIGAVWSDLDELRELGLVDINYGDIPLVWETLVADINAKGGVNGRQLDMVLEQYNPVFTASVEAMCITLTEDENVFAVVGSLAGPAMEAVTCFVDDNETPLVAGTHRPDLLERAKVPWITTGWAQERRYEALLELYDQESLLEGKLATFDQAADHDPLTEEIILPKLNDLGYEVTTQISSTGPQGDEVALAQEVEVLAERLAQDEIDTLLIVQNQIALGLPLMRESGFEGTIVTIDSGSYLSGLGGFDERDPAVYTGAYGPTLFTTEEVWAMESTLECVEIFNAAHPDIEILPAEDVPDGEPSWASVLLPACRFLQVFTMVAEGAGADLNPETFGAAAAELGAFEMAGQPFNSLSEGKFDADDGMGLGVFDPTVGEFGGLVPIIPYVSTTGG